VLDLCPVGPCPALPAPASVARPNPSPSRRPARPRVPPSGRRRPVRRFDPTPSRKVSGVENASVSQAGGISAPRAGNERDSKADNCFFHGWGPSSAAYSLPDLTQSVGRTFSASPGLGDRSPASGPEVGPAVRRVDPQGSESVDPRQPDLVPHPRARVAPPTR
jgi:hypothetical protein